MIDEPTDYRVFNKPISKFTRSAPDFVYMERFLEETRMTQWQIKKIIKDRDSNGANFFLHQISLTKWMLSLSLFQEWNEQRRKRREKIKIGESK